MRERLLIHVMSYVYKVNAILSLVQKPQQQIMICEKRKDVFSVLLKTIVRTVVIA